MPNRMYQRGRAKEYRIMDKKRKEGWPYATRTAGSHSLFDVITLRPPRGNEPGEALLIQSKGGKSGKTQRKKVEGSGIRAYEGIYRIKVEVV